MATPPSCSIITKCKWFSINYFTISDNTVSSSSNSGAHRALVNIPLPCAWAADEWEYPRARRAVSTNWLKRTSLRTSTNSACSSLLSICSTTQKTGSMRPVCKYKKYSWLEHWLTHGPSPHYTTASERKNTKEITPHFLSFHQDRRRGKFFKMGTDSNKSFNRLDYI